MKSGCSSLAGACKQLLLYHWMDQTRLTSLKACQLHLGSVDRRNSEQGGQPFRLCTSTLLWISSYLRSISWISVDKPSLSSFQASKQAGKGTEIKRVQPGGTCMALQPHSRRRLIFELDLRHVKSHLWLFVNCPLAELCKAHWEGPLGRPTGKAHGKAHYSHEEVTKAWSKIPPSALRRRNRWRSRWAMWALLSRYVTLLYHVRAFGDLQDVSHSKNSGNRKHVRNEHWIQNLYENIR